MTVAFDSDRPRPRGWTFDIGLPDIIGPCTSAEGLALYGALLTDDCEVSQRFRRAGGGLLHFAGLTGRAAERLLNALPVDALDDRDNGSPTLGAFLQSAAAHPGEVELFGYCVGPDRTDERVSVEGVLIYNDDWGYRIQEDSGSDLPFRHETWCECAALWSAARTDYDLQDALTFPLELGTRWPAWHAWNRLAYRLSWAPRVSDSSAAARE